MRRNSAKDYRQQQATNERRRAKDMLRKVKAHNRMMQRDRMLSEKSLKRMKELYKVRVENAASEQMIKKILDNQLFG